MLSWARIFLTESRHYGILFMETFYNVVNAIICCAKVARASIVLDIECECNLSWKIVKTCRIIGLNIGRKRANSVRGLYLKKNNSAS